MKEQKQILTIKIIAYVLKVKGNSCEMVAYKEYWNTNLKYLALNKLMKLIMGLGSNLIQFILKWLSTTKRYCQWLKLR